MIQIEQHYEENVKVGDFLFAKVGVTMKSDKALSTPDEVEAHSSKLFEMAKADVRKKLEEIKEEKGVA